MACIIMVVSKTNTKKKGEVISKVLEVFRRNPTKAFRASDVTNKLKSLNKQTVRTAVARLAALGSLKKSTSKDGITSYTYNAKVAAAQAKKAETKAKPKAAAKKKPAAKAKPKAKPKAKLVESAPSTETKPAENA
jgi:Fe2+ or Zn2+ uptake regulation protein